MICTHALVLNARGIHARPSAHIASVMQTFSSTVTLSLDGTSGSAKNTIDIMSLMLVPGCRVEIAAEGEDEKAACACAKELLEKQYVYENRPAA
jgi:phosphocarrier protein HPr